MLFMVDTGLCNRELPLATAALYSLYIKISNSVLSLKRQLVFVVIDNTVWIQVHRFRDYKYKDMKVFDLSNFL